MNKDKNLYMEQYSVFCYKVRLVDKNDPVNSTIEFGGVVHSMQQMDRTMLYNLCTEHDCDTGWTLDLLKGVKTKLSSKEYEDGYYVYIHAMRIK